MQIVSLFFELSKPSEGLKNYKNIQHVLCSLCAHECLCCACWLNVFVYKIFVNAAASLRHPVINFMNATWTKNLPINTEGTFLAPMLWCVFDILRSVLFFKSNVWIELNIAKYKKALTSGRLRILENFSRTWGK
jgi:hypothetical protein